ncbi:MAG: aldo/keto reductase [Anaerolineae bacterium]|nr:aldo/keto reductase [Anaerolineae bacterium]
MQYRKFGKLDWQVSALGFGCMRLPTLGSYAEIDEPEATRMLHRAIDQGVNYVDTAYGYHGGQSEVVVGRALKAGNYRERVHLATKLPCWHVKSAQDFDRLLNEQLGKLQTDTVDFYLLHALNKNQWHKMRDLDVLDWADKAIASGRIRTLGFSFHDDYEAFQEIVDATDRWTFCQIQYNYMDIENQAGTRGLQYAAAKGLAVVIMEPLLGGNLVNPPQPVQSLWDAAPVSRSPAGWALQWLWNQPEVSVVLSGMSEMAHVEDNLASANASGVGALTADDLARVEQARQLYHSLRPIPCTQCQYCMPCPNGLNIPRNFDIFNRGIMYGRLEDARQEYAHRVPEAERASECIACLACESLCPQSIPISEWMPIVHSVLGEGQDYDESMRP